MKLDLLMIIFNENSGSTSGGKDMKGNISISRTEYDELTGKIALLEENAGKSKSLEDENSKKVKELQSGLSNITAERDELKDKFTALTNSVKRTYLEQLSDEHKSIAVHLPTIESLAEYVILNRKQPPAGTDSGKSGAGYKDYSAVKWDDMSYDEKEDLRKKRPEVWKKLYKGKFGRNP